MALAGVTSVLLTEPHSFGNDPFTKTLLHCDGTNGSTTLTDSSAYVKPWACAGSATISTAQSQFGGASLRVGTAASSYGFSNTAGSMTDFTFGTGDFTIDLWVKLSGFTAAAICVDFRDTVILSPCPILYLDGSAHLTFHDGVSVLCVGTTSSGFGWNHLAVTRSGTSTKIWMNGVQEGSTASDSNNYTVGDHRPLLGISNDATAAPVDGWIEEVRISKGIARWNAAFTPPAVPYS